MSNNNGHNNHGYATPPTLLTIAGFDPSCGAGIASNLKTFAAHGCYGVAAITSLTLTVQPVGSVALAALILGEAPTALQLVGVAVVVAAVITATAPGARALPKQILRLRADQRRHSGPVLGADVTVGAAHDDHR